MARGLAIILGAILLFAAILALAGIGMSGRVRVIVIAGAVAGMALLYWWDQRREKKEAARLKTEGEKRFQELSGLAARSQFELPVTGASGIGLVIGAIVMGGAILLFGVAKYNLLAILSGAAFLLAGAILLLRAIPMLGAPLISITARGFKTPLGPPIDWKLVDGIHLFETKYRGSTINHVLTFRIGSLPQHISEFALFQRLVHRIAPKAGKERLIVVLKNTNEQPDVVYRLVRLLWTRSTGRDYDWDPNISEETNTALRKMKEATDRMEKDQKAGLALPRSPEDLDRELKEMNANFAVVQKELKSKMRWAKWIQYLVIALLILYFLVRVFGRGR